MSYFQTLPHVKSRPSLAVQYEKAKGGQYTKVKRGAVQPKVKWAVRIKQKGGITHSTRSAMSEALQHVIVLPRPISSPHCAVVVTMGSIPASSHISTNSNGPNPLMSSDPHFAPSDLRSHGTWSRTHASVKKWVLQFYTTHNQVRDWVWDNKYDRRMRSPHQQAREHVCASLCM